MGAFNSNRKGFQKYAFMVTVFIAYAWPHRNYSARNDTYTIDMGMGREKNLLLVQVEGRRTYLCMLHL